MEGTGGEHSSLPIALLVAPCAGKLRIHTPKLFHGGREWVEAGQEVASVEHAGGQDPVVAPTRGRLGGLMGRDGEPVKAGQPVAWMEALGEQTAWMRPVREEPA